MKISKCEKFTAETTKKLLKLFCPFKMNHKKSKLCKNFLSEEINAIYCYTDFTELLEYWKKFHNMMQFTKNIALACSGMGVEWI